LDFAEHAPVNQSVVYRIGALTIDDYDEAIRNLTDARDQIKRDELAYGCGYCGSDDHHPNVCHHNPLVRAREAVGQLNREHWRCFHCGEVFAACESVQAREHFGFRGMRVPRCFEVALRKVGIEIVPAEEGVELVLHFPEHPPNV
jgi:hypothetical protein